MTQPTTEELRTLIEKAAKLIRLFVWRIRFTNYGYKKTKCHGIPVISLRTWWGFSGGHADCFGIDDHPHDGADEEIWAMLQ